MSKANSDVEPLSEHGWDALGQQQVRFSLIEDGDELHDAIRQLASEASDGEISAEAIQEFRQQLDDVESLVEEGLAPLADLDPYDGRSSRLGPDASTSADD
jgi:hypothetical protein